MKCPVCNIPRSRNAAATREAMLAAARRRFVDESYENVGLRDIAGDVGVDATLVNRYFGSKEQLFKEVLRGGKSKKFEGPPEDLPQTLAAMCCGDGGHEDPYAVERLLIILRSASSPQAAEIVSQTVHEDVLGPLAALLEGDSTELRASLGLAVMIGTTVLRSILEVSTMGDCDRGMLQARLSDLFRVALADTPRCPLGHREGLGDARSDGAG